MIQASSSVLSKPHSAELFKKLQSRFMQNMHRHTGIEWESVRLKLESTPAKLWSLHEMERTDGQPDVVGIDKETGEFLFVDCSPESPLGRRSLCYDMDALTSRKENKPLGSAMEMAKQMGVELLNEIQYLELQSLENFDTKTSSWVKTPDAIRLLGGALFGDYRYGKVFFYHNGASSYYSARGFRSILMV